MIYGTGVTLAVLFSGVLPWLQLQLEKLSINSILQGVVFFFTLFAVMGILRYPLGLYETFCIEGRFGFNRMTLKMYLIDTLKAVALSVVIGMPFLFAVLWFMNASGRYWWLWAYLFIFGFQIVMIFIYPTLIAPWFNKFKPLDDGELKTHLLQLAQKIRFPTRGVFVMDGSRRSTHSNAYFTGFGRFRRIVLFDTLIGQMSVPEMEGILCHEMGHYKKGHIYKMLILSFIFQGVGLYILSLAIDWAPMYQAFGFHADPVGLRHVGVFLFVTVSSTFTFLLAPLMNFRSRKHEFQADAFTAEHTETSAMESALMKLAEKNLSNLTPHPWYSFFHYSHPTLYERIRALRGLAKS
jgi:STE24 endopeptidase